MGRVLVRALRVAAPIVVLTAFDLLQNSPELVWLVPAVSALAKGLRDKFPSLRWLPV